MNMNKYEKEFLDNTNLEAPDECVLSKAKSAMPQKNRCAKINSRQLFAIISSCAIVFVIIICIPFMLPAKSNFEIIRDTDLERTEIVSIADYNIKENHNILSFDSNDITYKYSYKGTTVLLEEYTTLMDTNIVLLVKLNDTTKNLIFEKEESYIQYSISDKTVQWSNVENTIYVTCTYDGYTYYIKMTGNISDWQNLINEFLF